MVYKNKTESKIFSFRFALLTICIFIFKPVLSQELEKSVSKVENKVIEWRHHIHQNPELSNREFKTAELVADHLKSLGIKVTTGVAHTGVVGILKGNKPGKVVALRADMDALPVTEEIIFLTNLMWFLIQWKKNWSNACLWSRYACCNFDGSC